MTVEIAGRTFKSMAKVADHIRFIVGRYVDYESLDNEDVEFMLAILERHPRASEKIGCGVISMHIESTMEFGGRSRGFWLLRNDGTGTDFSWRKCLRMKPVGHDANVRSALRAIVASDVATYKHALFGGLADKDGLVRCPKTGRMITFDESQVDHVEPFAVLVDRWLAECGLTYDAIEVIGFGDGQAVKMLKDSSLASRFRLWHNSHAQLRIIAQSENAKPRAHQAALFE